jgi:hypothetical protein
VVTITLAARAAGVSGGSGRIACALAGQSEWGWAAPLTSEPDRSDDEHAVQVDAGDAATLRQKGLDFMARRAVKRSALGSHVDEEFGDEMSRVAVWAHRLRNVWIAAEHGGEPAGNCIANWVPVVLVGLCAVDRHRPRSGSDSGVEDHIESAFCLCR